MVTIQSAKDVVKYNYDPEDYLNVCVQVVNCSLQASFVLFQGAIQVTQDPSPSPKMLTEEETTR